MQQNKNIKLSIIVPVYNVAPYLRDCIDSLLYHKDEYTEIIIIDDGSTDESAQICDEYENSETLVRVQHQRNAGQSAARNAGLSVARGIYICYVDSDDYLSSDVLNHIVDLMDRSEADMAVADYVPISHKVKFRPVAQDCSTIRYNEINAETFIQSIQTYTLMVWNKVYRRESFSDITFPVGVIYEDIYYTHQVISKIKKAIAVRCPLYYYRTQRPGSTAHSFNSARFPGYVFMEKWADEIKLKYDGYTYECIATYAADFFEIQYMECQMLLNDKDIMRGILEKYRKFVKDTPFKFLPFYRSIFRLCPTLYTKLKMTKKKLKACYGINRKD